VCVCVYVCVCARVCVCVRSCVLDWVGEDSFSVVAHWLRLWLRASHFVSTNSHEENYVLTIVPTDGHGHYEAVRRLLCFGQKYSVVLVQYNQSSCLLKTYNFHGLIGEIVLGYEVAKKYVFITRHCSVVFCW